MGGFLHPLAPLLDMEVAWGSCARPSTMIDHGCLRCIFCFRIKEKEKNTFYINFYSTIFI